jgi:hypothetical protein
VTKQSPPRRRLLAVFRLGVRRLYGKLAGAESTRLVLSVTGIAVAIMLLTTVSGIALGLGSQTAVQSDNVDYWVVPESGDVQSIAVSTGGTQLGNTHAVSAEIAADERVDHATPVLLQVIPIAGSSGPEYVLFVGVVPPEEGNPTVPGLPTASLSPGDPYYANGSYDGEWTGEAVLNPTTAELLNVSAGGQIDIPRVDQPITTAEVAEGDFTTGVGSVPVALVHLSELQQMADVTGTDSADQILVNTNAAGVESRLEGIYPKTTVVTQTGIAAEDASISSLPLAMAVAAFITALVVGVLFTATMMGLEGRQTGRPLGHSPHSVTPADR